MTKISTQDRGRARQARPAPVLDGFGQPLALSLVTAANASASPVPYHDVWPVHDAVHCWGAPLCDPTIRE